MDTNSHNKITQTFLDLVQIDSPSGEEDEIREYLIARLKKAGIESEVDEIGNLFARIKGTGDPVVLSCHMDTVEPGRGIKPIVDNGTVRSSGNTILGADNKVAVAAILHLLENLPSVHKPLEVIFSVREETEGGVNHFDFSKLHSKVGIVPDKDSPIGVIVDSSPGVIDIKITVEGKTAHAGRPHKGNNALTPSVEALSQIKLGQINDKTTVNIGIVKGGNARNAIPGALYLEGEVRSFDKQSLRNTVDEIKDIFSHSATAHGAKLDFVSELQFDTYTFQTDGVGITPILEAMESNNIKPSIEKSFGASDANTFSAKGIEVVNIGDGSKDAHTVNESVEESELVKLFELLKTYISIQS